MAVLIDNQPCTTPDYQVVTDVFGECQRHPILEVERPPMKRVRLEPYKPMNQEESDLQEEIGEPESEPERVETEDYEGESEERVESDVESESEPENMLGEEGESEESESEDIVLKKQDFAALLQYARLSFPEQLNLIAQPHIVTEYK